MSKSFVEKWLFKPSRTHASSIGDFHWHFLPIVMGFAHIVAKVSVSV